MTLKHIAIYIWWLAVVLSTLSACDHENLGYPRPSTPTLLDITSAQAWFEATYGKKYTTNYQKNTASTPIPILNIDWTNAIITTNNNQATVECDWTYNNATNTFQYADKYVNTDIVDRLVILQTKNIDSLIAFRMVALPTTNTPLQEKNAPYLDSHDTFNGIILFFNMNGQFVNGWLYQDGLIYAGLQPHTMDTINSSVQRISAFIVDVTECTTVYAGAEYEGTELLTPITSCQTHHTWMFTDDQIAQRTIDGVYKYDPGYIAGAGNNGSITLPKKTIDPCDFLQQIQNNTILNEWIIEYTQKAKTTSCEAGYCKKNDGTFVFPTKATNHFLTYNNTLSNGKYLERVHMHPDLSGGSAIPSPSDLNALYNMLKNNQIDNINTFKYVIVSSTGTLILSIINETDFKQFCINFEISSKKYTKYYEAFLSSNLYQSSDPNVFGDEMAIFFNDLHAGLRCTYGIPNDYTINWNVKQVNADGSVLNINCK